MEICSGHDFSKIEDRGLGHSDPGTPRCIHTSELGFLPQIIYELYEAGTDRCTDGQFKSNPKDQREADYCIIMVTMVAIH